MRLPTPLEKEQLLEYLVESKYGQNVSEDEILDERYAIEYTKMVVFDDYITDGPGYAGRVLVVVWGADPAYTETFIWQKEKLPGYENVPFKDAKFSEPKLKKVEIEV